MGDVPRLKGRDIERACVWGTRLGPFLNLSFTVQLCVSYLPSSSHKPLIYGVATLLLTPSGHRED